VGVNEMLIYFPIFLPNWIKFGTKDYTQCCYTIMSFVDIIITLLFECPALSGGITRLLLVLSAFLLGKKKLFILMTIQGTTGVADGMQRRVVRPAGSIDCRRWQNGRKKCIF
jgi:hypothetical protein